MKKPLKCVLSVYTNSETALAVREIRLPNRRSGFPSLLTNDGGAELASIAGKPPFVFAPHACEVVEDTRNHVKV